MSTIREDIIDKAVMIQEQIDDALETMGPDRKAYLDETQRLALAACLSSCRGLASRIEKNAAAWRDLLAAQVPA